MSRRADLILLVSAVVVGGCAGEIDHPERFAECAPGYVEQLFQESCSGGGDCHDSSDPEAGLDLVSPGAQARLMGTLSAQEACEGAPPLIDPAGGDHLVIQKLSDGAPCGARMPFGEAKLSASDIECVKRWVDEAVATEGGS